MLMTAPAEPDVARRVFLTSFTAEFTVKATVKASLTIREDEIRESLGLDPQDEIGEEEIADWADTKGIDGSLFELQDVLDWGASPAKIQITGHSSYFHEPAGFVPLPGLEDVTVFEAQR